jgi:hypothetical protein
MTVPPSGTTQQEHVPQRRHRYTIGLILVLLSMLTAVPMRAELEILNLKTLILDGTANTGRYDILIRNTSDRPVSVLLITSPFVSKMTGQEIGAQVSFLGESATAGTPYLKFEGLTAGGILPVRIEVSNLWEAGESTAELSNVFSTQAEKLGILRVEKDRVPFDIKLNDNKTDVVLDRGSQGEITLRNNDGMTYLAHWDLTVRGKTITGHEDVMIPPHSTKTILFKPPGEWFGTSVNSRFKEDVEPATLNLRFDPGSTVNAPNRPAAVIPITMHLGAHHSVFIDFVVDLLIFVLLFLGAACSLVLHYWAPNRLKRIDLKEQLSRLQERVGRLSSEIDSSTRVAADVECSRWVKMLYSRWIFSPDLQNVFTKCTEAVASLTLRIDLLEQIDSGYQRLDEMAASAPPTRLNQIREMLSEAANRLNTTDSSEQDLHEAQKRIGAASASIDTLDDADPKFAGELASRVKEISETIEGAKESYLKIREALPALFVALNEANKDASKIEPKAYRDLDAHTIALELLCDFVSHKPSVSAAEAVKRYEQAQTSLVQLLSRESCEALKTAGVIIRQWHEGIFLDDVAEAIRKKDVSIETRSPVLTANDPVQLKVSFARAEFNQSAARQEIQCLWDFDDAFAERGWEVSHYFAKPRDYNVKVSFRDWSGSYVSDANGTIYCTKSLHVRPKPKRKLDRTITEVVKFAIVLVATLVGLITGAREQVLKLDVAAAIVAVFLVGFSADTVKNLLTERSQ